MENKNNSGVNKCAASSCSCGCCCVHGGKMRLVFLLRVLVMVVILMVVFWCGFCLGCLRGSLNRAHRGYQMMEQGGCGDISGGKTCGIVPYGAEQRATSTIQ